MKKLLAVILVVILSTSCIINIYAKESKSYFNIKDFFDMIIQTIKINTFEAEQQSFKEQIRKLEIEQNLKEKELKKEINTENILFIGNSLIEGIKISTNTSHNFICKVGISLDGLKDNYYNKINNYNFNTVIIGMGTNELGYYTKEHFEKSYIDLINKIKSVNPNADIITLSIPPVSQNKSSKDKNYNNNNVKIYNEYVKEISKNYNTYYIDNSKFFGEVLSYNWTGDGIHFNGSIYKNWYEFIINEIKNI